MILKSLESKGLVKGKFNWQWHYYFLNDEGPAALTKQQRPQRITDPAGHGEGKGKGKGKGKKGKGKGKGGWSRGKGGYRGGYGGEEKQWGGDGEQQQEGG